MVHGVKTFEDALSEILEPFDNGLDIELVSVIVTSRVQIEGLCHNIAKRLMV
jgi:hypothetical protein